MKVGLATTITSSNRIKRKTKRRQRKENARKKKGKRNGTNTNCTFTTPKRVGSEHSVPRVVVARGAHMNISALSFYIGGEAVTRTVEAPERADAGCLTEGG
jgi:hypothetical protein